jgi:membrane protease YdiL (CAAX protease family)
MTPPIRPRPSPRDPAAFLAGAGALERGPLRLAGFLLSALPAAFAAALVVGLALTAGAAGSLAQQQGLSFLEALGRILDGHAGRRSLLSYWYELTVAGVASYAAALVVLGLAARFYRRPMRSFLVAGPRFRWPVVGSGFLLGLATVGLAVVAQHVWSKPDSAAPLFQPGETLGARLGYAALAAACLYLAALAEEIIFRGVLLQLTGAFTRRLPLILAVNGIVFSFAHFDPDPSAFLIRAVMGVGWAWIALRTGGIEMTTGVHLANNLLVSLFVMPVSFHPAAAHKLDPTAVLVELLTVLLSVLGAELLVRRATRASLAAPEALASVTPTD